MYIVRIVHADIYDTATTYSGPFPDWDTADEYIQHHGRLWPEDECYAEYLNGVGRWLQKHEHAKH